MYLTQIKLLKILNEIEAGTRQPMTVTELRGELKIINPASKMCFLLDDLKETGYLARLHYDSYSPTETIKFKLSLRGLMYKYELWHNRFHWFIDNLLPIVAIIVAVIGLFL